MGVSINRIKGEKQNLKKHSKYKTTICSFNMN